MMTLSSLHNVMQRSFGILLSACVRLLFKQAVSKVPSQGVTLITPHSSVCRPSSIVFRMTAGNELPPNLFADSCTSDKDLTFFTIRTLCVNATC